MSCNCNDIEKNRPDFICRCDDFIHPMPLNIPAGHPGLRRQIAGFPEFRRAMLRTIATKPALAKWRTRDRNDLGVMLIEMWAYCCDSLSFYDKVIADEQYVGTAFLRPSLRKLVALLGYLPSPAVASSAMIAVMLDGKNQIRIPRGTAFRSIAFGENAPQVFELLKDAVLHPFNNKWRITGVENDRLTFDNPDWLLVKPMVDIRPYAQLVLMNYDDPAFQQSLQVKAADPYTGADGKRYIKLVFTESVNLKKGTVLSRLWLVVPDNNSILRYYSANVSLKDAYSLSRLKTYASALGIEQDYAWKFNAEEKFLERPEPRALELANRFAVATAGTIVSEIKMVVSPGDRLKFEKMPENAGSEFKAAVFGLIDKNQHGAVVKGFVNYETPALELNMGEDWAPDLQVPVDVYGNLVEAVRGESVLNEVLGSGNATIANQQFKLEKSPLTYIAAPTALNDRGVQNTLHVYVNGMRWQEVPSFFGRKPDEEIYIVRQDDEESSYVIFGDGVRGKRLDSGNGNIMADYQYGAGEAAPPADSITQLQSTVTGLSSLRNPLPAAGGKDADSAQALKKNAPRTALILGRAVSIKDMEAVALAAPGVRNAQVEWRWHPERQTPVVYVWYIGDAGIQVKLTQRLRSLTDPSLPIVVDRAVGVPLPLKIDIETDPRWRSEQTLAQLRDLLMKPVEGWLSPEQQGVGKAIFRSALFEKIQSVKSVTSVRHILWNNEPFNEYGMKPNPGTYFDFEAGGLYLNGKP
jgi:hypothetical protein